MKGIFEVLKRLFHYFGLLLSEKVLNLIKNNKIKDASLKIEMI